MFTNRVVQPKSEHLCQKGAVNCVDKDIEINN